jgi:hypothetical protein
MGFVANVLFVLTSCHVADEFFPKMGPTLTPSTFSREKVESYHITGGEEVLVRAPIFGLGQLWDYAIQ